MQYGMDHESELCKKESGEFQTPQRSQVEGASSKSVAEQDLLMLKTLQQNLQQGSSSQDLSTLIGNLSGNSCISR